MKWIGQASKYLLFTGKGGVGKTSLACAAAIKLADQNKRVLLISTDPASNLQHVLETAIGKHESTAIVAVPGLFALNIDPEAAAGAYRERVIGPVRGKLPEQVIQGIEEQLSGACTTEIACFDQFTSLLADPERTRGFDHLIFDTAPTGHTLRLLRLPAAWTGFLENNQQGTSCLGSLSGLDAQRDQYAAAVRILSDPRQSTLVLVSRPDRSALAEAGRTRDELLQLGMRNQRLVTNGVFRATDSNDTLAVALQSRGERSVVEMPAVLRELPRDEVPLRSQNAVGIEMLRSMFKPHPLASAEPAAPIESSLPPPLRPLVDQLAEAGPCLIMVMGKGGVGKTTIAAAIAVHLASQGHKVHLTTTDPSAHVVQTLAGEAVNLQVSRIDPQVETDRYRQRVLQTNGKNLDEDGRALLEEDLRSPCTEEVAVFHAFSRIVGEARRQFVVMDTAPTGHTLLLLDATGAYHREVMRNLAGKAGKTITPMARLQDAAYTKVLMVTLPETTPVLEASALQDDLRRAGIEPFAWVVNGSLAAASPSDPLLSCRAHAEIQQLDKVRTLLARRTAVTPQCAEAPVGLSRLMELVNVG